MQQQTPVASVPAAAAAGAQRAPTTAPAAAAPPAASSDGVPDWAAVMRSEPVLMEINATYETNPNAPPLRSRDAQALLGVIRAPRSPEARVLALIFCTMLAAKGGSLQLINAGLIPELITCISHKPDASADPISTTRTPFVSAWGALGALLGMQPSAGLAALRGPQGAPFSAVLAAVPHSAALHPATSSAAFDALSILAGTSEKAAVRIAGDAAVMQAAVQQTNTLQPATAGSLGKPGCLSFLSFLLRPDNPSTTPEARTLTAQTPGIAEAALRVLAALTPGGRQPSRRSNNQLHTLWHALAVLGSLLQINKAAADAVLEALSINDPAKGDAAIRFFLRTASDPDPELASRAAAACHYLASWEPGCAALLRQPLVATALIAAVRRPPDGLGTISDLYRNGAALMAIGTAGRLLGASGGEQLAEMLEGMAPAVTGALLPRLLDICPSMGPSGQGPDERLAWGPNQAWHIVGGMQAFMDPLIDGCADGGRMSAAASAPRLLIELARCTAVAVKNYARSRGSYSGTGRSDLGEGREDTHAYMQMTGDRLMMAVEAWTAAARRAPRPAAGEPPLWDAGEVRALLAAMRPVVAWLTKHECEDTEGMGEWCEAVMGELAELAGGGEAPAGATDQKQKVQQQQQRQAPSSTDGSLDNAAGGAACAVCGATSGPGGAALKRCKGCRSPAPKYCSAACYEAGWPAHKAACKAAKRAAAAQGRQGQS